MACSNAAKPAPAPTAGNRLQKDRLGSAISSNNSRRDPRGQARLHAAPPAARIPQRLQATLHGGDRAEIFGLTIRSDAPVLKLCRWLVRAGYDPGLPLEVFRDGTLALRVRSIR